MKTELIIKRLEDSLNKYGEIPAISNSTGLPKAWLYKVARGNIKAPQAARVDTLREYFQQQQDEAA